MTCVWKLYGVCRDSVDGRLYEKICLLGPGAILILVMNARNSSEENKLNRPLCLRKLLGSRHAGGELILSESGFPERGELHALIPRKDEYEIDVSDNDCPPSENDDEPPFEV